MRKKDDSTFDQKLYFAGISSVLLFFLLKVGCGPGVRYSADSGSGSPSPSPFSACTPHASPPKRAVNFDGSTGSISVNAPFTVGPNMTIEFFLRFPPSAILRNILNMNTGNTTDTQINLETTNFLTVNLPSTSCSGGVGTLSSNSPLSSNTPYHVAITRDSSNLKLYLNGIINSTIAIASTSCPQTGISLGRTLSSTNPLPGDLDQIRISKTIRYTNNFSPPVTNFCPDADTLLYLSFDQGGSNADYPTSSTFTLQGGTNFFSSPFY